MAVPKRRIGRGRRNRRRSHLAKKPQLLQVCLQCKALVPGHTACPNCGTYRGRQVIDVLAKLNKQERREKEKKQATGG